MKRGNKSNVNTDGKEKQGEQERGRNKGSRAASQEISPEVLTRGAKNNPQMKKLVGRSGY